MSRLTSTGACNVTEFADEAAVRRTHAVPYRPATSRVSLTPEKEDYMYGQNGVGAAIGTATGGAALAATGGTALGWIVLAAMLFVISGVAVFRLATRGKRVTA
ncbi:hypothetical protein [Streptomyces cellulosae]|nr:hypothetical protein [Streptomyces cellulosae]